MSPTGSEFNRVDLGPRNPHFEGTESQQGGQVPDTYQRIDTAQNSDPSASLHSSTFRPGLEPQNLLDEQQRQVKEVIDAKLDFNSAWGLEQPIAGPGVKSWTRDERQHGNQQPDGEKGIPTFRDK